jgi:hypothetical protein
MKSSGIFGLILLAGCAFGGGIENGDPPASSKPGPMPAPAGDAATEPDSGSAEPDSGSGGGISGGGYGFTTPHQMFDAVNQIRQQYSNHIPYDGYPFQGANANAMTWATILTWDDALAADAQKEAERLASGGMAQGTYFPFMNDGSGEGFYTWGLTSAEYGLATRGDGALPQFKNAYGVLEPPHHAYMAANGFYRMGVAYQTGSGAYNKKTKLGVGAAEGGTNITWWVLIFG